MTRPTRAAALALLALAGCGGGTASVSGKVTFQGKPVVYGTVVLIGADGLPRSGQIQPDGTFTVPGVAVGTAKAAVSSPPPPGAEPAKKAARGGRDAEDDERAPPPPPAPVDPAVVKGWFPLPEKYGDPDKSGLTVQVGSGQPADFDLK